MIGDAGREVAEEIAFGILDSKSKGMAPFISAELNKARDLIQEAGAILDGLGNVEETIWNEQLDDFYDRTSELAVDIDNLASEIGKE